MSLLDSIKTIKVALESVMKEALEAAEKAGAAIFGEEGAKVRFESPRVKDFII